MFKRRIKVTGGCLLALGALVLLYQYLVVPKLIQQQTMTSWDSSSIVEQTADIGVANLSDETSPLGQYEPFLRHLFAEKDWRRSNANIIIPKGKTALLLFRNAPTFSNGNKTLELEACTIIVLGGNNRMPLEERYQRAFVFETSDKAKMTFRQPLTTSSFELDFSAFDNAELTGQVICRSKMDPNDPNDDIQISTRTVTFNMSQILVNQEIIFRIGRQSGEGEGLKIDMTLPLFNTLIGDKVDENELQVALAPVEQALKDGNLGGGINILRMEMQKLNKLTFSLEGDISRWTPMGRNVPSPSEAAIDPAETVTQAELRCEKGFYFAPNPEETAGWVGRFMGAVEVCILNVHEKPDTLKCQNLYLYLTDPNLKKIFKEAGEKEDLSLRKKLPSGQIMELKAQKIKAVRAEEMPVIVTVPRLKLEAQADEFLYDIPSKSLAMQILAPSQRVKLIKDSMILEAEYISYTPGADSSIGMILAGKNGRLDATFEERREKSRLQARWNDGLRIMTEPENKELIRVSLKGGVDFSLEGKGTIAAEEADFWGTLPKQNGPPIRGTIPQEATPDPLSLLRSIRPESAKFRGNIRMTTGRGVGNLQEELTIRFQQVSPSTNQLSQNALAPAPSQGGDFFGNGGSLFGNNNDLSRYEMDAARLDIWILLKQDEEPEVTQFRVQEKVQFRERSAKNQEETLRFEGEEVLVFNPSSTKAVIDLRGKPDKTASFNGKGLQLIGYHVNINRGNNTFAVNGPGKLTFLPQTKESNTIGSMRFDVPVDVSWSKEMTFNGQTLIFSANANENVTVLQQMNSVQCPEIRLSLKTPLIIFDMQTIAQNGKISLLPELEIIEGLGRADQPVRVSAVSMGNAVSIGNIANKAESIPAENSSQEVPIYYEGEFEQIVLRYSTSDFVAKGPGWLKVTTNMEISPSKSQSSTNLVNDLLAQEWKRFHLIFQESIEGNVNQRFAVAKRQVKSVFCTTNKRTTLLDVSKHETFPSGAFYLNCEELRVSQNPNNKGQEKPPFEFKASGNTLFRQGPFTGRGDSISYSSSKSIVYLSGDGITPASLHRQDENNGNRNVSFGQFMRGSINIDTGKFEAENFSSVAGGGM